MIDAGDSVSTTTIPAAPTQEKGEAESSKCAPLLSKAEKFAALEQLMTRHLNDLQTDCDSESPDNLHKWNQQIHHNPNHKMQNSRVQSPSTIFSL